MNIYDLFPSRYVAAVDLNGHDVTVEIHHVEIEEMGAPPKVELKPVVHFSNAKKGMVLNKTNAMLISSLYGPETDGWAGKRITLYVANVKAFGSMQKAIRVREFIPRPKPTDTVPDSLMAQPEADNGPDLDYQEDAPPPAQKTQPRPAQPATTNAGSDRPEWRSPVEAQAWAVEVGACQDDKAARTSWMKVAKEVYPDSRGMTPDQLPAVFDAYYQHQVEKMEFASYDAVQEDAA